MTGPKLSPASWWQAPLRITRKLAGPAVRGNGIDFIIAIGLGTTYLWLLLATESGLGYARDEGFYFGAAEAYGAWFDLLLQNPSQAIDFRVVDRHFSVNHEHPVLIKSLMALAYRVLFEEWGWVDKPGTAYRIPGMLLGSLAVALTYGWAARWLGRLPALVGAVSLGMMPRVFFHSHLACFDVPVASLWLLTTLAYWWALEHGGVGRAVLVGILYGLLLNTKHNAWLLPPALLVHWLLTRHSSLWRAARALRLLALVPWPLVAMGLLGPSVLLLTWPWLWHQATERLTEWYTFHRHHVYYNMEFLGRTYFTPPMPRLYPWLMTIATVPAVTLILSVVGMLALGRRHVFHAIHVLRGRTRTSGDEHPVEADETRGEPPRAAESAYVLWGVCVLTSYAPWLSSDTPIFGGTKHWITAYPFLGLFCAAGFRSVLEGLAPLRTRLRLDGLRGHAVGVGLALAVVVGPITMTLSASEWGLSAYAPVVGGAPGAATLGLNRTFWGYSTGSVATYLNNHVRPGQSVYVHDTALPSFRMMQRDGTLRPDLQPTLSIAGSAAALYHHEPHMGRVEYQIWTNYGTTVPSRLGTHHGVPVVWVYLRPESRSPASRPALWPIPGSKQVPRSDNAVR